MLLLMIDWLIDLWRSTSRFILKLFWIWLSEILCLFHATIFSIIFQISDQGVVALSERCQTLKELHVSSCYGVTDKSVTALAKHSIDLTELDVSWCFSVTDQSIKEFLSPRCKLKLLRIKGCAVSTSMVSRLVIQYRIFLWELN